MPILRACETREMCLFGKVIDLATTVADTSLPEFIARRRMPGETWLTWDQIRYELANISGQIVTDQTLRKWAQRYGIPEDTSPNGVEGTKPAAYRKALTKADITVP